MMRAYNSMRVGHPLAFACEKISSVLSQSNRAGGGGVGFETTTISSLLSSRPPFRSSPPPPKIPSQMPQSPVIAEYTPTRIKIPTIKRRTMIKVRKSGDLFHHDTGDAVGSPLCSASGPWMSSNGFFTWSSKGAMSPKSANDLEEDRIDEGSCALLALSAFAPRDLVNLWAPIPTIAAANKIPLPIKSLFEAG